MKQINFLFSKVMAFFSKVPIFGTLTVIPKSAQKEALFQMLLNVAFATLPIWFGSLIISIDRYFSKSFTDTSFFEIYSSTMMINISSGELLMYTAAMLGPVLYIGIRNINKQKVERPFPGVGTLLFVAIMINLFASVLYFFTRGRDYTGDETFVLLTFLCYFVSLTILFPPMAFQAAEARKPEDAMREDQDDFQAGYQQHRR